MSSPTKGSSWKLPCKREAIWGEYRWPSSSILKLVEMSIGLPESSRSFNRVYRAAVTKLPGSSVPKSSTISKSQFFSFATAQLQDSEWYYDTDMKGGTAIVMGTEATGLTDAWRKAADAHIKIPMLGRLDSLNVSVSAAILMFEAVRQRNSHL